MCGPGYYLQREALGSLHGAECLQTVLVASPGTFRGGTMGSRAQIPQRDELSTNEVAMDLQAYLSGSEPCPGGATLLNMVL